MSLKKLLESSVLNDETKQVLEAEFNEAVNAAKVEMEAEYQSKFDESVKELNGLVPGMIEEAVAETLGDLAEEIKEARSLEITYAEKLNQFKESYNTKMQELVDTSVAECVAEEVEELKEDIEMAKKHSFAMKIVESFGDVYNQMFNQDQFDVAVKLKEMEAQLESYQRKEKLDELLEGLTGAKRTVAETILESVSVDKMEKKFDSIKSILLAESKTEDKDEKVTESENKDEPKGTVVMEDEDKPVEVVKESEKEELTSEQKRKMELVARSLKRVKA